MSDVVFHCVRGRTTKKIGLYDLQIVDDLDPQVIILLVGGNDLCSPDTSPLWTASAIQDLAVALAQIYRCHRLFVGSIQPHMYVTYTEVFPHLPQQGIPVQQHLAQPPRTGGGTHVLEDPRRIQPGGSHIHVGRRPL